MFILAIILGLIIIALLVFEWRTIKAEKDPRQREFTNGHLPDPLPDGFYNGVVRGYTGSWIGKTFNLAATTGINNFSDGNTLYPFAFYPGTGLRDPNTSVLKIDYNQPGNSFWIRMVVDEVVETQPGAYLGKIQLRLLGFHFTLGYFTLNKSQ